MRRQLSTSSAFTQLARPLAESPTRCTDKQNRGSPNALTRLSSTSMSDTLRILINLTPNQRTPASNRPLRGKRSWMQPAAGYFAEAPAAALHAHSVSCLTSPTTSAYGSAQQLLRRTRSACSLPLFERKASPLFDRPPTPRASSAPPPPPGSGAPRCATHLS